MQNFSILTQCNGNKLHTFYMEFRIGITFSLLIVPFLSSCPALATVQGCWKNYKRQLCITPFVGRSANTMVCNPICPMHSIVKTTILCSGNLHSNHACMCTFVYTRNLRIDWQTSNRFVATTVSGFPFAQMVKAQ